MSKSDNKLSYLLAIVRIRGRITRTLKFLQTRIVTFLIFLLISSLGWLLISLNDTYKATIKYPVRYINLPKGKTFISPPPNRLHLLIEADGYTILNTKIKPKMKLNALKFDVNAFSLSSIEEDSLSFYTLTRHYTDRMSIDLGGNNKGIKILKIYPDTIFFNFTTQVRKKLAVRPKVNYSDEFLMKQYIVNGPIKSTPDCVLVAGPAFLLDTIDEVTTEDIVFHHLSDTVSKTFNLNRLNDITYAYRKVEVQIPVDKFTEISRERPIEIYNMPDTFRVKTFPTTVKITLQVSESYYRRADSLPLNPYINFNDIDLRDPELTSRLRIYIDSIPSYIHNINIYPSNTEFLIEKINAQDRNNRRNR